MSLHDINCKLIAVVNVCCCTHDNHQGLYVNVWVCIHTCVYMCMCTHFAVHLYVHMSVTLCTCANVCMCLWEFVSVCNYTFAHDVCVHVHIC